MASMVVLIGAMPSLPATASVSSSTSYHSVSLSFVRRASISRRNFRATKRWLCRCKYSVSTADFVASTVSSLEDSTVDQDDGFLLKPGPKPMPKSQGPLGLNSSVSWDEEEERNKVIESLGEVLEKAEKLETTSNSDHGSRKVGASNYPNLNTNGNVNVNINKPSSPPSSRSPKSGDSHGEVGNRKTKTLKSVWKKGDSVGSVQRVVKESPKIPQSRYVKDASKQVVEVKEEVRASVPIRPPQLPPKPQPKLQLKPSVAPPRPVVKKPTVLKDVGAAQLEEADPSIKSKERKPILIDKFASKKAAADPLIAQAVSTPRKPGKPLPPLKFKDDYRKKNASAGLKRRIKDNDMETADEETSELNVSIPGAARKGRKWSKASRKAARLQAARDAAPVKVEILEVGEKGMLVEELAYNLAISEGEILGYLYSKGIKLDGVQTLDQDMVKMVCNEYEVEVINSDPVRVEERAKKKEMFDEDDLDKLESRPPVLTVMGHVDHGKTTLLDHIRKSKVAASEAGGITQGIGAYKVMVPVDGKLQLCVFLDTPGHEAFGAMRARGAQVTDIAVIVVAADDGIRPQTNEAIAHAKAAGVPIVIAINKIDKDGASPERVMQELSSVGLMSEDWGGDTPMVQISALKGDNVDDLLETVMLVAELQDLKANPQRNAKGTVIEAGLHKSKGPVATFIVQNGTLKRGDVVVCGDAFGKVRALFDDGGNRVDEAGPSIPVQVIGLNNVPIAGDEFEVVGSLDLAREKAEARGESLRDERISAKAGDGKLTLSSLASAVSSGRLSGLDLHQLNIILKVDLQGSIEAVRQALQVLPQDNVTLKFLLEATGDVSNSDVDLAVASKAIILGFNVKAPGSVKSHADNKGVEIRLYRVIYELIDDVRNAMEGLLDLVEEHETIGLAEVRAVFSSGSGRVAGCMVTEGKVVKDCGIRVIRNRKIVHVGVVDSLKRVKEVVKEVSAGLECGIGVDGFSSWDEGDKLEFFTTVQKKRTLEEASATMAAAVEGTGIQL